MQELLIVFTDREVLEQVSVLAAIEWVSRISNVAIIFASIDQIENIRALPGILSVEEPKVGTFMV